MSQPPAGNPVGAPTGGEPSGRPSGGDPVGKPIGCDVLVVGGGIAGASLAYFLAPHRRVILLEREDQCGYHSTGRSAAQYIETYGPPQVRALTRASRAFFERPPAGFAAAPVLHPRGALSVAWTGQGDLLEQAWAELGQAPRGGGPGAAPSRAAVRLDAEAALARVPVLRREGLLGAVWEPDSFDMDVDLLLQGYLRGLRRAGGELRTGQEVLQATRCGRAWQLHTRDACFEAPVLVNAAGAWADELARLAGAPAIGLVPRRRSAFSFAAPAGQDTAGWPLVLGIDHGFYFKPDAGQLLGSPANQDDCAPQDVQPEELDIALGVDAIERATTLAVRPKHRWAGLRSFVADGGLVGGFDPAAEGLFWCAAQGGYGIQTSAAMGQACAALVLGRPLPENVRLQGLGEADLSPARLRR